MAAHLLLAAALLSQVGGQSNITKGTEHCQRPSCADETWTSKMEGSTQNAHGNNMTWCTMLPSNKRSHNQIQRNIRRATDAIQDLLEKEGKVLTGEGVRTLLNDVMESYCESLGTCTNPEGCKSKNLITFDGKNPFYTQPDSRQKKNKGAKNLHHSQGRGNQR